MYSIRHRVVQCRDNFIMDQLTPELRNMFAEQLFGAFVENGVAGVPMCVIYEDFASDVLVTGYSVAPGEIIRVLAGGAITKGDNVVGAANGRVTSEGAAASARSANTLGTALEAASGTGVVIRVRMGK
ncbi:MAG: hypothetical protein UY00_C0043G0008 [Candidatus Wolfebacteria bacterium GW2011_GWA1_47_6]|nr:MAG: hypothetical protein UY00_C0043G0008 [Candidatus Wolfebacteria bacterium GW2011_GWA1_47_6]